MARPVDEEIYKLTLENSAFMRNLDQTIAGLTKFKAGMEKSTQVNASGFSKFTSTISSGVASLLSKIPILGKFKKGTEDAVNANPSPFQKFSASIGSAIGGIMSKIPVLGKFKSQVSDSINVSSAPMDKLAGDVASDVGHINGSIGTIGNGVTAVSQKFSILAGAAAVALGNIATNAIQTGKQVIDSFTLDPIKDGYSEYELKMKSITTIMTNTGRSVGDVNKVLNDLNTYSDKTIYAFSDMTTAIGSMASAGIGLEDAGHVVKGFYNAAAATGVEANRMGSLLQTALIPSLNRGYMGLQDFRQLSDAGFGEGFKKQALEVAKEMGKTVDETTAFTDELQKGWLSTDVLIEATKRFEKNKAYENAATKVKTFTAFMDTAKESVGSGWAQTWETVFGNVDQAQNLWTPLSNIFGDMVSESANARNAMLDQWTKMGGRDNFVATLTNSMKLLTGTIKMVKSQFKDVFGITPEKQAKALNNAFKALAKIMEPTAAKMNFVKDVARGLASMLQLALTPIRIFGSLIKNMIPKGTGGGILDMVAALARWITSVNEAVQKGDGLKAVFKGIQDAGKGFNKFVQSIVTSIKEMTKGFDGFKSVGSFIGKIFSGIGESLSGLVGKFNGIDWANIAVMGTFIAFAKQLSGITKNFKSLGKGIADAGKSIGNVFEVFDGLTDSLSALTDNIKADTLKKIAISLGILAASILVLSTIKTEKLITSLTALTIALKVMQNGMLAISKADLKVAKVMGAAVAMNAMASAMLIMSAAVKVFSTMDLGELAKGLGGVAAAMVIMTQGLKSLGKVGPGVLAGAGAMILVADALTLLMIPIKMMSKMSLKELAKGIGGVAAAMGIMAAGLKGISKVASGPDVLMASAALIGMASAMAIMSVSIKALGNMSWESLAKGLTGVAGGLAVMVAASKLMTPKSSAGLLGMASAMLVLSTALKQMGGMSWESLGKGMVGLSGGLTAMGLAMKFIGGNVSGAASLMVMATAMLPMAAAMKIMGSIPMKNIGAGLIGFAGAVTILVAASYGLQGAALGMVALVAGAAGLAVAAGAMLIMSAAIKALASVSPGDLAKSIIALAAGMGVLVVAGMAMTGASVGFIALGAGLALVGVGIMGLGAGVYDLAQAFMTLSKIDMSKAVKNLVLAVHEGLKLIPTITKAIIDAFDQLLAGIVQVMPNIVKALGSIIDGLAKLIPNVMNFITKFLDAFLTLVPKLGEVGRKILNEFLLGIMVEVPLIIQTASVIITAFIDAMVQLIPRIAEAGLMIVQAILTSIAEHMPDIVQAGTDIIVNFLLGIASGVTQIAYAATQVIVAFITAIGDNALLIANAAADTLIRFVNGLAEAVDTKGPELNAAVWKLMNAIVNNIINFISGGQIKLQGQNTIQSFIGGAINTAGTIWNNIVRFFTAIPGNIAKALSSLYSTGVKSFNQAVQGAAAGVRNIWGAIAGFFTSIPGRVSSAWSGLYNTASGAFSRLVSGAASGASRLWGSISGFFSSIPGQISGAIGDLTSIGGNIVQGIINGVTGAAGRLADSVAGMAKGAIDTVKRTLGIHSPSREFRDQVGQYIPLGMAEGIERMSDKVKSASSRMGQMALDAVSDIQTQINDNMDWNPTITPVVDMSNVDANAFNGTLNSAIASANQNGYTYQTPGGGSTVSMGNLSIEMNVPDGQSGQETLEVFRNNFRQVIADELRKVPRR